VAKVRVDSLLVERGYFESRSRAAAAILAGDVAVGGSAVKPGQMVDRDVDVAIASRPRYASRGGVKLENALRSLGLSAAGRRCLDVGASTGGFTDCLLEHGAAYVVALDVAYGALDWRLRTDDRVTTMDRVNARTLDCGDLPYRPDLIVVDVSFISLTKVLPAVLACAAGDFDCLALVKPQFEAGRQHVGKGGVVRTAEARRGALLAVAEAVSRLRYSIAGFASSGLPGPKGNRESFVWIRPHGDPRAVDDLDAAARTVEP
jgi:23S rRNA (cytidine1920-2'-O)/16S rRNA (cytidine1409-2'-O)-methyltransferase